MGPVAEAVFQQGHYGRIVRQTTDDGVAIPSGMGGDEGYTGHAICYVGVDDLEASLQQAERLGGTRVLGHFRDPQGQLIGLAGPRSSPGVIERQASRVGLKISQYLRTLALRDAQDNEGKS